MFTKPLPRLCVRVFQRMEALIADHNDRLVPVHFKKLIQLARFGEHAQYF
jgi:hypothetical protein